MEPTQETRAICHFCQTAPFKYTCPRCNILYCSVACYKSPAHLKCSEDFYKKCIQDELTSNLDPNSSDDMRKMYEILRRMREEDAGLQPEDFDQDQLDSDDDEDDRQRSDDANEEEIDGEENDLAARMQGIDINNAEAVWECLSATEREEFQQMVECGDIMKLLPTYKPWWVGSKRQNSKIVELPKKGAEATKPDDACIPTIAPNILPFTTICKKAPAPCLHFNLWNIFAAYACTVRYYAGEHQTNPGEGAAQLVNLCATLKYGTNFEDADDAIVSVEMEALTTGNGATTPIALVESREQLQSDARDLMFTQHFKLAALSDLLQLLQSARAQFRRHVDGSERKEAEFHKLFAMCNGSIELSPKKLQALVKKVEFLLSFVQRGTDDHLI